MTKEEALYKYTLRLGDDALIVSQRLSEWCGHGPILEEDIALTNIALDLVGQATSLLEYAAKVEGKGRSADDLAYLRYERDYTNLLLCEQPNGDFGATIVRQFLFSAYQQFMYLALTKSSDEQLAAIAEKSLKEVKYHVKHSAEWVIRLGDGTEESHQRVQASLDDLWRFSQEIFFEDEVNQTLVEAGVIVSLEDLRGDWENLVKQVINESTLKMPETKWQLDGGRKGLHTEHLGYLLAEMQYMQRAYPGMEW